MSAPITDPAQLEKIESFRERLQSIKDDPKTDMEKAYRSEVLEGMSDPKHWDPTLPMLVGYGLQVFEKGFEAARAATLASEPVYWSLTYQGEHTANVFREESKAQETLDRLNKKYPDEDDARAIVPLYAGVPVDENVVTLPKRLTAAGIA